MSILHRMPRDLVPVIGGFLGCKKPTTFIIHDTWLPSIFIKVYNDRSFKFKEAYTNSWIHGHADEILPAPNAVADLRVMNAVGEHAWKQHVHNRKATAIVKALKNLLRHSVIRCSGAFDFPLKGLVTMQCPGYSNAVYSTIGISDATDLVYSGPVDWNSNHDLFYVFDEIEHCLRYIHGHVRLQMPTSYFKRKRKKKRMLKATRYKKKKQHN